MVAILRQLFLICKEGMVDGNPGNAQDLVKGELNLFQPAVAHVFPQGMVFTHRVPLSGSVHVVAGPHGLDGLVDEIVQLPPQHFSPLADHIPGAAGGELLSLNFFFTDLTSRSETLLEGRISAAAPMRPVSSSVAKRTFSIGCSGRMPTVMP